MASIAKQVSPPNFGWRSKLIITTVTKRPSINRRRRDLLFHFRHALQPHRARLVVDINYSGPPAAHTTPLAGRHRCMTSQKEDLYFRRVNIDELASTRIFAEIMC